jgi:hypothetical protein
MGCKRPGPKSFLGAEYEIYEAVIEFQIRRGMVSCKEIDYYNLLRRERESVKQRHSFRRHHDIETMVKKKNYMMLDERYYLYEI